MIEAVGKLDVQRFFETLAKIIGEQEGVVITVKSIRLKEPSDKDDSAEAS